jgi:plasmid stability protein
MSYDSRTADKFVLRMPDGMRDEIAARAKTNGRSMNAEMVMMMRNQLNGGASLCDSATALITLVELELGERTQERRDQDYKWAVKDFMTGRGLPRNALEVVVRGGTGAGKTTFIKAIMPGLQSLLNSAPRSDLASIPCVYLIQSGTTFSALQVVADRHERVVFIRDEQESR